MKSQITLTVVEDQDPLQGLPLRKQPACRYSRGRIVARATIASVEDLGLQWTRRGIRRRVRLHLTDIRKEAAAPEGPPSPG